MKIVTERSTGTPKLPFLTIAPNGAPIKKNKKHAMARLYFLCHSILCLFMIISLYFQATMMRFSY